MAKQKRSKSRPNRSLKKSRQKLFLIPFFALITKLIIITRIQGFDFYAAGNGNLVNGLGLMLDKNFVPQHAWYGADGENYIRGLWGLAKDGFFSQEGKLSYWPAGYPLLMWPLLTVFKGSFFLSLSVVQSLLFGLACLFFIDEILQSRLNKFALPVALLINFNPTLALNTIAVGYELPTVSLSLISAASMLRFYRLSKNSIFAPELLLGAASFALATFMQPRLIILAIFSLGVWALANFPIKSSLLALSLSFVILTMGPIVLIERNMKANGFAAISTNLGTTMGIGAGPEATGGYNGKYNGVPCPEADQAKNASAADSAKVRCILKWYVTNPGSTIKLFWNKSRFFWSPWFGPENNGTMARNPWRISHPLANTIKTESGFAMVFGTFGRVCSWLWMVGQITLLIWGFRFLWRAKGPESLLALIALGSVLLNWASALLTIGDNRFRIPSMGMSLFLQVVGLVALIAPRARRLPGSGIAIPWSGIYWKRKATPDNLAS